MRNGIGGILLSVFGAVLLKIASGDLYLRYIRPELQILVLATGVLVLLVGLVRLTWSSLGSEDRSEGDNAHGHRHDLLPVSSWLLLLVVGLLVFVPPPALGSYSAGRQLTNVTDPKDAQLGILTGEAPHAVSVRGWAARAVWGDRETLQETPVVLEGFVTPGPGRQWYVSRVAVNCCAADGYAFRVQVDTDTPPPPADTWVQVQGTLSQDDLTASDTSIPILEATEVTLLSTPENPYQDVSVRP